jgi:hypothetical protein
MSETILIDRILAVQKFTDMLEGTSKKRILRIIGEGKMGKSRLLQEFGKLSREKWKAHCAFTDLHLNLQGYSNIVYEITLQIPVVEYINFSETRQQISSSPKVEIKRLNLLFSSILVNIPDQKRNSDDEYIRQQITSSFYKDLYSANLDCPTVLLFDTFDSAGLNIQNWLNEQFFLAILQIPNVYLVLAGRSLREPPNAWLDICETYTLLPVTLEDYISYCNHLGINTSREIIEAFHKVFNGTPGLFAEYAPKLLEEK